MGKKQEKDLRIVQLVVDSVIAERDAEIAALRQQVAELQAWQDAVPVEAISRYYYGTIQIEGIYTDDEYNYDSSILEQWIGDMA